MNDTRFESCIKCTVCTTTCPVSRVNPRYPGPKQAGPDGERLRLKDGALYDEALKYCINCKRCEVACPSDVCTTTDGLWTTETASTVAVRMCRYLLPPPKLLGCGCSSKATSRSPTTI